MHVFTRCACTRALAHVQTIFINSGDQSWHMLKFSWSFDLIWLRYWGVLPSNTFGNNIRQTLLKFNIDAMTKPILSDTYLDKWFYFTKLGEPFPTLNDDYFTNVLTNDLNIFRQPIFTWHMFTPMISFNKYLLVDPLFQTNATRGVIAALVVVAIFVIYSLVDRYTYLFVCYRQVDRFVCYMFFICAKMIPSFKFPVRNPQCPPSSKCRQYSFVTLLLLNMLGRWNLVQCTCIDIRISRF